MVQSVSTEHPPASVSKDQVCVPQAVRSATASAAATPRVLPFTGAVTSASASACAKPRG